MQDYLLVKRKTVLNKFKSKTFLTKIQIKFLCPKQHSNQDLNLQYLLQPNQQKSKLRNHDLICRNIFVIKVQMMAQI